MKIKVTNLFLPALVVFTFGAFSGTAILTAKGTARQSPPPKPVPLPAVLLTQNHNYGLPKAAYTLVEFGDYECPPCRAQSPAVFAMVNRHKDRLRYAFKNFPLIFHTNAKKAAVVAESIQGNNKFWEVHQKLMHADDLQAYTAEFVVTNQAAAKARATVDADMELAKTFEVNATPSFFLCTPEGTVYKLGSLAQVDELVTQ